MTHLMERKIYEVAGHRFAVTADEALTRQMTQYAPFAVDDDGSNPVFCLTEVGEEPFPDSAMTVETTQDDDGSQIVAGHTADGSSYFEFLLFGDRSARIIASPDYKSAKVWLDKHQLFGINNALMVMYALATANLRTALFHSAVVSRGGRGYMFLGKSGTGKSTHASLL